MNGTLQPSSRPLGVKIALVILLIVIGSSFAPRLAHAKWSNHFLCMEYAFEVGIASFMTWFIFRGKNWARWFLVLVCVAGLCSSVPNVVKHIRQPSLWWILTYGAGNLVDVAILVALFHPSSSEWFLRDRRRRHERQRMQAEVESEIRREYEDRLSKAGDYWQRVEIEAEIARRVKERMEFVYNAKAV